MRNRYKLTGRELDRLVENGIISHSEVIDLKTASLMREPGEFANRQDEVSFLFNPSGGSVIRSIHFYGGEHFGEPYCFLAEVVVHGNHDSFYRFLEQEGIEWIIDRIAFTY